MLRAGGSSPARALWAASLVLVAIVAPAVRAHEAEPGLRPRLLAVVPEVDGLTVEVGQVMAPTVTVRNRTGAPIDVVGGDGTPFLRIGPDAVHANVASPDFFRSESPSPAVAVPSSAAPGTPARFVAISRGAEWSWFEHRVTAAAGGSWAVPLVADGTAVSIRGDWERIEVTGSFRVTVDGLEPAVDGLRVDPLQGAVPGLFVDNRTGRVLEVPGRRGEPFLRIGPDVTERADGEGGWSQVAASPRYGWTEPRIGWPAGVGLPDELRAAAGERTARTWSLEMSLGGRPVVLSGVLRWVPVGVHHGDGPPVGAFVTAFTVLAIVAVAGAAVLRRRSAAGDPP